MHKKVLDLAIDGNEANVKKRVGSNVYAFEMLKAIYNLLKTNPSFSVTILLRKQPLEDLPKPQPRWRYLVIGPNRFWSYLALSIHLTQTHYDVFYTPGHYIPLVSQVPMISSIMDLGFLAYPQSFKFKDWLKLTVGTKWAVKRVARVVAISQFTKNEITKYYSTSPQEIILAPPAPPLKLEITQKEQKLIIEKLKLHFKFFLYLGTFQPRKNLPFLIKAYETFAKEYLTDHSPETLPKLVLAGKIGWLEKDTLKAIKNSSQKNNIINLGFVTESEKATLYTQALGNFLLSFYEGFGMPILEGMIYGCIPVVANCSSLPEVVGKTGIKVSLDNTQELVTAFHSLSNMKKDQARYQRALIKQRLQNYTWDNSALSILKKVKLLAQKN